MTALGVSSLAVFSALHLWAGPHVFDQLLKASKGVSLATAWRPVVNVLSEVMALDVARTVVSMASVVVVIALTWALWQIVGSRPATQHIATAKPISVTEQTQSAMAATFVLATAYALGAPYALPWYAILTWATLPLMLATVLDWILLAWLTVMAMAYVPGRVVAMSAHVESLTLGFRKIVGPLAAWLLLLAIAYVARRGSARVVPQPRR